MWRLIPLSVLLACGGPSPEFRGAEATRIEIAGSVFDIRIKGDRAEAVRLNAEYAPRMGPIGVKAGFAIEAVSGCRAIGITGDQAMIRARLECGEYGRSRPSIPHSLDCELLVFPSEPRMADADLTCRVSPN